MMQVFLVIIGLIFLAGVLSGVFLKENLEE